MRRAWQVFWNDPEEREVGPKSIVLFDEPVAIDWEGSGTALVRRLRYEAEGRLPLISASLGWQERTEDTFQISFESPALRSALEVRTHSGSAQLHVTSIDDAPVQDADIEQWRSMVRNCL